MRLEPRGIEYHPDLAVDAAIDVDALHALDRQQPA